MRKEASFGLIFIVEALEPQEREAGTKFGCLTKSESHLMSTGKRTFGWVQASFMYVHETSNRVKSKFLPKVRILYIPTVGQTTL